MDELSKIDVNKISDQVWSMIIEYGPKLFLALITLLIGLWIIKHLARLAEKGMMAGKADVALGHFVKRVISWVLKLLLILSVASMIGIETTSFIAIFSAATLAVGLALQGSLANLAGGVVLLVFRPYKIGDLVEVKGHFGRVSKIQLFNTILLNPQNKTVIIPNGAAANDSIINYTTEGKIRVDLIAGVSYESDLKRAKEVLMSVMVNDPLVLKDPTPFVGVDEMADSSVNFAVRPWTDPDNYWPVYFRINENIKLALDEAGITIPFPQVDVHMNN